MSTGPVVCFGELLLRLSPPDAKLMAQSDTLDVVVAGAEANVAAALSSLGHFARYVTVLPDNAPARRARATLGAFGIDTRFVTDGPGRMGLFFLEIGAGQRPSMITYDRSGSAFAVADPTSIDFAAALEGARLLHVSGITPALGPNGVELARAAVAAARAADVPICFDGNYRAQLWDSWDSRPAEILSELVADATILLGNHRDISLLLGKTFSGDGPQRRREAAEAAFARFPNLALIASTARHIVTSAHHRIAARADTRETFHQTDEIDITEIVDRIGSGDAFAAGVLHRWLDGGDVRAMAEGGLALTALKHSIHGDMSYIRWADLDAFSAAGADVKR